MTPYPSPLTDLDILLSHFDTIATAPGGITRLRQLILQLAVQGRLVAQDPNDEPASVLLERIRTEKSKLISQQKLDILFSDVPQYRLPSSWVWTTLDEMGFINPRNNVPDEHEVAFIPMTLIPQEFGETVRSEIRLWGEIKKGFTHFAEGDVVLAKITPCFQNGKAAVMRSLSNGMGAGTTELHVFRPLPNTVLSEYAYIYLKSPDFVRDGIPRMTGTAGQKRVPNDYFALNPFPLPPLAEQRRIVERVDALMALCDTLEQHQTQQDAERRRLLTALITALLNAGDAEAAATAWARISESFDTLFTVPEDLAPLRQAVLQLAVQGRLVAQDANDEPASVLLERIKVEKARLLKEGKLKKIEPSEPISGEQQPFMVPEGWEWVRLKSLGSFLGGGTPSKTQPEYWNGNIPWVSPKDMKRPYINDSQDHISESALAETPVQLVPSNSVLFVVRGMILSHSFPVALNTSRLAINQDLKALNFYWNGKGLASFALLIGQASRDRVLNMVERSTHGTCKLNTERLENLAMPLPPLAEQRRIVARVEQLMALCDRLEARLREQHAAAQQLSEALCGAIAAGAHRAYAEHEQLVAEDRLLELPQPVLVCDLDGYVVFAAYSIQQHIFAKRDRRLGHYKLEKMAHLAEAYASIDLGRQPRVLAHGPADAQLQEQLIARGEELAAFRSVRRETTNSGYHFEKLPALDELAGRLDEVFGDYVARLRELVELMVPLRTRQAEAIATLYAVWNQLLQTGNTPNDEQLFAAFRAFHPQKQYFKEEMLDRWLCWMREHGIVPDGSAKPTLPA